MANSMELATAYVSIVTDTRDVPRQLDRAFGNAGADAGETAGEAAGGGIADKLKSMGGKAGPIAAAVGVIGLAAGGLLVASISAGMEREKVADLTQARLGVDDATMRKLGTAAGRSYTAAFGESVQENMEVAGQAMQAGLFSADAPVAEIEEIINSLQGVNEILGQDIAETTKSVSALLKNGLAGSAEEAFDLLASAAQTNGLANEDLLESVNQYANGWKNAGFSGQQAFALIAQSIEKGAPDTDRAGDALREFGRRVTEEGETIVETLDGIGLNGTEMYEAFKRGGPDAFAAFDKAFDTIRELEDPTERNAAAMALLGDTAGDFIDSLAQWDPSAAMDKFGNSTGAATNAVATLGGNSASSIESAKRSIEVSMQGVQNSLAQAFGPTLQKVATWVEQHQPEITGFFIKVGEAAFTLGDILLLWASTTSTNLAVVLRSFGDTLEGILDPIGTAAVAVGELTGKQGLVDFGNSLKSAQDKLNAAADGLDGFATTIDGKVRPSLANMRDGFVESAEEAKSAQLVMRALGDEVTAIPNGKNIIIDSNTPEQTAALESLGLKVTQLPDGRFEVSAGTADAQKTLDGFVAQNNGKKIAIQAEVALSARVQNGDLTVSGASPWATKQADGGILGFADGKLPDDAMIQKGRGAGLVQWAEGETKGEAFIPLALAKRDRSVAIWKEVGRRFGFDVDSMANGGILDWARTQAGKVYQYGGTGNPSWDCSGIAGALWAKATGKPTNARYFTTDSDFGAMGWQRGMGGEHDLSIGTNGGSGTNGHMASTVDGVNVESSSGDGVEVGAGALGAGNFAQQWHWPLGGNPTGGGAGTGGSGGASAGGSGGNSAGTLGSGGSTNSTGALEVFVVNMPGGTNSFTGGTGTDTAALDTSTDPALSNPATDAPVTDNAITTEQASHPLQGTPLTGELFNGDAPWYMASSPEQALANLSTQAATQWESTASDLQGFVSDNWKEMLSTGASVLGMGAMSGGSGMTVNNYGMSPEGAAAAVERQLRRTNLATMRQGGFGR